MATLTESSKQEIADSLDPNDFVLTDNPELVSVISESYSPSEHQPASELSLILRLEFKAPYISAEDQDDFADAILETNLPPGYAQVPGTVESVWLTSPEFGEGSTTPWRIRLIQDIQSEPSVSQIVDLSRGRSPQEAQQAVMDSLPLSAPPQIKTNPSWWPLIPLIPIRIDVINLREAQASISSPGLVE